MNWLKLNMWRLGTGAAMLICVVLGFMLFTAYTQNNEIKAQRDQLQASITDPKTGYVARLTQANANVVTLKREIEVQNEAYDKLSRESQARITDTERKLALAQAQTRRMERQLAEFLSTGPQGSTLEERIRDIDRRALEEFLP